MDHIDLESCKKKGIKVFNSAGSAVEAVSEHAIMLVCSSYSKLYISLSNLPPQYFATRRSLIPLHTAIIDFDKDRPNPWKQRGSVVPRMLDANRKSPNICSQEVVGMVGYGRIGMLHIKRATARESYILTSSRKAHHRPLPRLRNEGPNRSP
jgi:glycerate dehydrogenase